MHRRAKAPEMQSETEGEEHLLDLCREVAEAGVLTPQELTYVRRLQHILDGQTAESVTESASGKLDIYMRVTCARCQLNWRVIPNRSHLQTALYYVFFKKIEPAFTPVVDSIPTLLELFPEFEDQTEDKQIERMEFANAVALLSRYIPPRQNKQVYIEVASRLASNFQRRFVTGGGQTRETHDRVLIYERLCGVVKSRRNRRTKEQIRMDEMNGVVSMSTRRKSRRRSKDPKENSSDEGDDSSTSQHGALEPKYSKQDLEELASRVIHPKLESRKRTLEADRGTSEVRPILPAQRTKQDERSAGRGVARSVYQMPMPMHHYPGILRPNSSSSAPARGSPPNSQRVAAPAPKRPAIAASEGPSIENWALPLLQAAMIQGDISDDDFLSDNEVESRSPPPPSSPPPTSPPPVRVQAFPPGSEKLRVPLHHPYHHHPYFQQLAMHHHVVAQAAHKLSFAKFNHGGQPFLEPPHNLEDL